MRARAYYSEAKEALRAEEAVFKAFKRDYAKEYKGWVLARKRLKRVKAAASSWTSRNRKWALAHLDKALGVAQ